MTKAHSIARPALSRRQFLAGATGLLAAQAFGQGGAQDTRPNIVLIIADTLRHDAMGCYGGRDDVTPELDALAEQSVQCACAFAASSWTLPSIGSMLTSQHPRTLALFESTHYLQENWATLAELLQAAGYRTLGTTANAMIDSVAGFARGFDSHTDANVIWEATDGPRTRSSDVMYAEALTLARSRADAPVYLQINIMEAHEYYLGAGNLTRPEFEDLYPEVPNTGHRRDYLQSVRQVSVDTDAFIRDIRALPGYENTLFIFCSDHGEGLDDHPGVWKSQGHGLLLYESMIRVPMLFYWPGQLKPARVRHPVQLLDIMPTVLEAAGIAPPPQLEGASLLPVLRGDLATEKTLPRFAVAETWRNKRDKTALSSSAFQRIHNRDFQAGCREYEFQRIGPPANGKHTDMNWRHPDIAWAMEAHLREWFDSHPKGRPVRVYDVVDDTQNRQEQLRALGYL